MKPRSSQTPWQVPGAPTPQPAPTVTGAIADLMRGQPFVLVDADGGGQVVVAGERVRAASVTFMARHARGLVSVALTPQRAAELGLQPQPGRSGRPFLVPIEARTGVSTGISAADRARTIKVVADLDSGPADLVSPGHVMPVLTDGDGVLATQQVPEAAVDLTRMAGLPAVAAICQVLDGDGAEARGEELAWICRKHRLRAVKVQDVAAYRRCREEGVERVAEAMLPTRAGDFRAVGYRSIVDGGEHLALICGELGADEPTLVRIQRQCLAGEVFQGLTCRCGEHLDAAIEEISARGSGVIVHLGCGGQLPCTLAAGEVSADAAHGIELTARRHESTLAAGILRDLAVGPVVLMQGAEERPHRLEVHGVKVAGSQLLSHGPARPARAAGL